MSFHVLIADDQKILRTVLRLAVEAHDDLSLCPEEAASGRQAIELAQRYRPDGVILDWEMPDMNGLDALPQIRQALPTGVIVMYSSQDSHTGPAAAMDAGADAYVQKGEHHPDAVVAMLADMLVSRAPS